MNYRIVEELAWTAFGKSFVTKLTEAYETVPAYWANGVEERLEIIRAAHGDDKTLVRSLLFDEDEETLRYARCLEMPAYGVAEDFERYEVPARTWTVFSKVMEPESDDGIIPIWKRIWVPGYKIILHGRVCDDVPAHHTTRGARGVRGSAGQERLAHRDAGRFGVR